MEDRTSALCLAGDVRVSMRQPSRGVMQTVADFKKEIQLERDIWEL